MRSIPVALVVLGALFVQGHLLVYRIPRFLFTINGYSTRRRRFWQRRKPDDPPWGKMQFAQFLAGLPLVVLVNVALMLLTVCIAKCLVWFRGLFH
jgi:hypothetical protein